MCFDDPKEFDDLQVYVASKGISFVSMDNDNPKVFGDTSIYDGHVVIFFFPLLVYSIMGCSRSSEGLFLMYSLLLLDCKKGETQRESLS